MQYFISKTNTNALNPCETNSPETFQGLGFASYEEARTELNKMENPRGFCIVEYEGA